MSIGLYPVPFALTATGSATYQQFEDGDVSLFAGGPDGFMAKSFMTSDGNIVADMTFRNGQADGVGTTYIIHETFQGSTVPEPSSLVLAASAMLMILTFAWMRGFFTR